jgi:hypothetical protein
VAPFNTQGSWAQEVLMKAVWICTLLIAGAQFTSFTGTVPADGQTAQAARGVTKAGTVSRRHKASKASPSTSVPAQAAATRPASQFPSMPLEFESNQGQAPSEYAFVAHGPSYSLGISANALSLLLRNSAPVASLASKLPSRIALPAGEAAQLQLQLADAKPDAAVAGIDEEPGNSNYFIGRDPSKWRTSVAHFSRVKIRDAWPGISLVFYGQLQQLEYDFAVRAGADARLIRLRPRGAQSVRLDEEGDAVLETAAGNVTLRHPVAYQETEGVRTSVDSRFRLQRGLLSIAVGRYDHRRALIIDPVLDYSASLGGSNGNWGMGLAVDATGDTYLTGHTCSADFPSTVGNFQTIHTDPSANYCQDAFVLKLDPTASTLIYSDYIGGANGYSTGSHAAVDSSGDVFVAGLTASADFPIVSNIGPSAPGPCSLAPSTINCPVGFVLKLSPDGSQLQFSSLLGGNGATGVDQVKLNPVSGDLDLVGATTAAAFEPSPNTLQTAFAGGTCGSSSCFNGFLLGFDPATGAFRYGTFLGGTGNGWASGLAFDSTGNIIVAGATRSALSGNLGAATQTYAPGGGAAQAGAEIFATKLDLANNTLTPGFLTLIQADADTGPAGIAADASGNIYFAGATAGTHLPVTGQAYQSSNNATSGNTCNWVGVLSAYLLPNACGTGIVGKLSATGALAFLTYLGGNSQDMAEAIGVDTSNNIWVAGATSSSNFPVTAGAFSVRLGPLTPFLAEMSSDGTQLSYATLMAGPYGQTSDLEIDSQNNIYVTGFYGSTGLGITNLAPTTPGTYPLNPGVYSPVFLDKWSPGNGPSLSLTPETPLAFPSVAVGSASPAETVSLQNTGGGAMELSFAFVPNSINSSDFLVSSNCGTSLAAGATCTITIVFAPGPAPASCTLPTCDPTSRNAELVISDNAPQGPQTINLGSVAAIGSAISVSPNPVVFPAQAAGTASTGLSLEVDSNGDSALLFSNIALSGPNASDFQLTTGNCLSAPVVPGTLCDVELVFSPPAAASGTRTATLTFTDNAGDSPQAVPVSGTVAGANALIVSPLTVSQTFPVAIGTSSYGQLMLQNPSPNSIQITSLNIAGTNMGDFSAAPAGCSASSPPITIASGTSCTVDVTFNPAAGASGLRTATMTVGTNPAISGLPTVALQGDAVTNSQPGMSFFEFPNPMNFGGLQVGETSSGSSVLFTISNEAPIPCANGGSFCGAPLVISSITPGISDYKLVALNGQSYCTAFPVTITTGGTCTLGVVFTPSQAGVRNTSLAIQSNDPQGTIQLPVYGTGLTLPLGAFLQTALNFGNSAIGVASPPLTTTLENVGQSALAISSVSASANFTVSGNNCPASLAPGATCSISITLTPPSAGFFTGTLTVTDSDALSAQQVVNLTGTGATGPQLRIAPATLNFQNQPANSASAPQPVTLTSTGDTTVTFSQNAVRSSADFILQSTTCGSSLAFGASCTVSIQFKPSTVGNPEAGTLLFTDNAAGSPQPIYMQGTGEQGTGASSTTVLVSSPNPSALGQSVTFTATVTGPSGNTTVPTGSMTFFDGILTLGTGTLNASGVATYSTSALPAGSNSITAAYGGDSTFNGSTSNVVTQVVSAGARSISMTAVTSSLNPSGQGQSVTFTATVTGPSGNPTAPTGIVAFMDGSTTLGTGSLSGSAQATYNTSSLSTGSHSITAVYAGDANFAGSTSTALTQTVNASGFTVSFNPSSVTVTAGQTATTTVTVTPQNGFNQQISFACSGLPAASTCNFSPATITRNGSAATSTLTIATDVAIAFPHAPSPFGSLQRKARLAVVLFGLGGLLSARRRWRSLFCAIVLLAGLGLTFSGCGGGGGSGTAGGGNSKTPSGTSTITVTVTAGSLSQNGSFTLIVQ